MWMPNVPADFHEWRTRIRLGISWQESQEVPPERFVVYAHYMTRTKLSWSQVVGTPWWRINRDLHYFAIEEEGATLVQQTKASF